jgi:hypothetical protein
MPRSSTNDDLELELEREPPIRRILQMSSRERRHELERLGIRKSRSSDLPVWALAALLVAAGAVAIVAAVTHSLSTDLAIGMATAVITVAGLLVAVLQWRAGLAEKAVDALYRRIALANQMRIEAFKGLRTDDEAVALEERPIDYRFFVFTEIDSLEYATIRYRYGLGMSGPIVDRAVRHFQRRCEESREFRATAADCAANGAYLQGTKHVVEEVVGRVDRAASGDVEPATEPSSPRGWLRRRVDRRHRKAQVRAQ